MRNQSAKQIIIKSRDRIKNFKPSYFEGVLTGFCLLGLYLVSKYGILFEFQGIKHGFRYYTLVDLSLFAFACNRFLTRRPFETICYTVIQYIFYDTIFAFSTYPNIDFWFTYTIGYHILIIGLMCYLLIFYYKLFHRQPSFKIRKLILYLLICSIPIYMTSLVFITYDTYNKGAGIVCDLDELFKWFVFPAFWFSRRKREKAMVSLK
jgi:hypothetical protein